MSAKSGWGAKSMSAYKTQVFVEGGKLLEKNWLHFFLDMSVKAKGEGIKALADISAKNVSLFRRLP